MSPDLSHLQGCERSGPASLLPLAAWILPPASGAAVLLALLLPRRDTAPDTPPPDRSPDPQTRALARSNAIQSIAFGLGWLAYFWGVERLASLAEPVPIVNIVSYPIHLILLAAGLAAGILVWIRALSCACRRRAWTLPGPGAWIERSLRGRHPDTRP